MIDYWMYVHEIPKNPLVRWPLILLFDLIFMMVCTEFFGMWDMVN